MILSNKQKRVYTLAILLHSGSAVSVDAIFKAVGCSGATLTRDLRDLRDLYGVEIKYSKSTHSYVLTSSGGLGQAEIAQMISQLKKSPLKPHNDTISLAKVKKKGLSISLSPVTIFKLNELVEQTGLSRGELITMMIESYSA